MQMQTNTSQNQNEQAELTPLTEAEISLVSGGNVDSATAKEIPTWPPVIKPS